MKLNIHTPNIERSENFDEKFFDIADKSLIFDILRSKLYSNPIGSICREISCNALDAHISAGKRDVSIEITLPNYIEPYWKCLDNGIGMSKETIENIYSNFGASTKRDNNELVGAYGLGAKVPLSYSQTFTIISRYNGMRYNYCAFIDETRIGKLALLSETATTEPNGVEIIIPVKTEDFDAFATATEKACRHWAVKPIIHGSQIIWNIPKKTLEGNNWFISYTGEYYNHGLHAIVGEIEYPLDLLEISKYIDISDINNIGGNIYLIFPIGALSLSASREQIHLDKQTQEVLKSAINNLIKEVKTKIVEKINTFSNYWDVCVFYSSEMRGMIRNIYKFMNTDLAWNNIPIHDQVNTSCAVVNFQRKKDRYSYRRSAKQDPNKLEKVVRYSLTFSNKSKLFINDLNKEIDLQCRNVKEYFIANPEISSIQIVCPNDTTTLEVLNKSIYLDKMNGELLSTIFKGSTKKPTKAKQKLTIYKYMGTGFKRCSHEEMENDENEKVWCLLSNEGHISNRNPIINNKRFSTYDLSILLNTNDTGAISFYGVDRETPEDRIKEEFEDNFIELEEYLKELVNIDRNEFIKTSYCEHYYSGNLNFDLFIDKIEDKNSLYLKQVEADIKIKESRKLSDLCRIYEFLYGKIENEEILEWIKNNPEYNLKLLKNKVEKRYPLLKLISSYYRSDYSKDIVEYINLIDKKYIERENTDVKNKLDEE